QAEDGIRDLTVTGVQTCALPIFGGAHLAEHPSGQGVDSARMSSVGLGEGVLTPSADGDDERGVAGFGQVVGLRNRCSAPTLAAEIGRASLGKECRVGWWRDA